MNTDSALHCAMTKHDNIHVYEIILTTCYEIYLEVKGDEKNEYPEYTEMLSITTQCLLFTMQHDFTNMSDAT
jgi:hypothetical protein